MPLGTVHEFSIKFSFNLIDSKILLTKWFCFRLPKSKSWISSKYLNEISVHDEITTSVTDGKIKINTSNNYECLSYSNLGLVVKYVPTQLKVVFVAPIKTHQIHQKGVLSTSAAENALMVSSDDSGNLSVWDSRTGKKSILCAFVVL